MPGHPESVIRIRKFRRDEVAVLERVFDGMSTLSRYLRYHSATSRLTGAHRRALTAVDDRRHVAFVAERLGTDGWRPEGLGRLVDVGGGHAEIAVEVVDVRHRQGTGEALVRALAAEARAMGFGWLTARVLRINAPMLRLLEKVFPDADVSPDGSALALDMHLWRLTTV